MYIDCLQAIDIAISAIKQLPETEENKQAITRLSNMKQDRYIKWTKELVFRYLDNWAKEHDHNPTVNNLSEPNMPKAATFHRLFDMKPSTFLNTYYPNNKPKEKRSKYSAKTKQEWIDNFIQQFNKIQPKSAREYDTKRDKSTPTWITLARYSNVSTWKELLEITNLDTQCLFNQSQFRPKTKQYSVNSTSSLYEKLEELLNKKMS